MRAILVANWKMNPTTSREAKKLFDATKKAADKAKKVQVIVAPPAIFLRDMTRGYRGRISFAVQNGYQETHGAHTGETSFTQARDAHATFALVGHAERRAMGETNENTCEKVAGALKAGLTPILCIGEIARSSHGEHFAYIQEQLRVGLSKVPATGLRRVYIAYEPVWAIGAAKPVTPNDMHQMAIFIRKSIVDLFGAAGMDMKILYGGSIDDTTAPAMLKDGDIKGFLVGRASAESQKVTNLLVAIENA